MAETAEFEQLMADVAAGSEEAVWQMAETYTPHILRAVRKTLPARLRQKLDSQDFAQTLWASILLKRTDLTRLKNPGQLIAYLARATKYKVVDKTRHYKAQKCNISREEALKEQAPELPESEDAQPLPHTEHAQALYARDPTPSTTASMRERWGQILASASERDRRILQLRLEGHTFDVISDKLRIHNATARKAMQRIIEQLSEEQ